MVSRFHNADSAGTRGRIACKRPEKVLLSGQTDLRAPTMLAVPCSPTREGERTGDDAYATPHTVVPPDSGMSMQFPVSRQSWRVAPAKPTLRQTRAKETTKS
jgi:hypothetical protein